MRLLRHAMRVVFRACGVIATFAVAAFAALQTSGGKEWISREVNARLAAIEIGRISGLIPMRTQIDRVTLRDAEGDWAELNGVTARVSMRAAMRGEIVVASLSAERLVILRRPARRAATEPSAGFVVPELRVPAAIRSLRIDRLSVCGLEDEMTVSGSAALATGRVARVALAAERRLERSTFFRVEADARGDTVQARLELAEAAGRGALAADLSLVGDRLSVTNLDLRIAPVRIGGAGTMRLRERIARASLDVRVKGGAWTREPLFARLDAEIRGDGASIRMDGPLEFAATAQAGRTSEGLNAVVVFTNAPLQMIRSGRGAHVDGRAHGEMHFAGTPSDPGVTGWAELSGGGVVSQPPRRLDISSARLEWSFRGGRARVSYAAQSDGVGRVEGEVVTPIEFGVVPWRFRLPKPSDARLAVRAEADVGRLARVLRNDDGLDVRGQMSVNVEARGELSRPVITGRIEVVGGELDHPPTGTSLREGVVRLAGDADSLRIVEAGVRDRAGGSILFGGSVSLNRSAGFPLAVTGRLARADVYGTPRVNANLDGTIALRGTLLEPRLEGRLAPRDLEIRLLRTKPLGVALPRVDIGLADAVAPAAGPAGPTWRDRLALDLRVEMEDRFRVTGRGLASEWRGQLRIQGTASEPRISGRLQLARGRQMFLGRRFDLTSGSIQWSGVPPEEMMLDLAAESRAADVTAQVRVTGPVSRPAIELASEPALPTDEILSRILFGRGIETITPFQAVMLANGVRQLQGGNSVSMLERGREWLGVDQVGITQASGQGDATVTGVSVGKYVNDRVYVFGEKGVGEAEDRVTVSFELTPSLSLETESSPRIREGIRLRWRRDF